MGGSSSKAKQDEPVHTDRRAPRGERRRVPRPRQQASEKDKAILELKAARDRVKRYQLKTESEVEKSRLEAKRLLKDGKKAKAIMLLKIIKSKESQLQKSDEQLLNLLQMVDTIEWEEKQLDVVKGLDAANKVLKNLHEVMSVEKVEEVMEDVREQTAMVEEINQILGSTLTPEDEEEVMAELEELEQLQMDELKLNLPEPPKPQEIVGTPLSEIPDMPAPPTTIPEVAKQTKTASKPQGQKERRAVAAT